MSNNKLNCCKCGKEFELTERIYASGDLWQCEDCAIKQMQENDDKDKTIADLEAKLAESEKRCDKQYSKIQRDSDYIYKLEEELEKKEDAIATWQTMYESVVQTCHNDAKEIERLNKLLAEKDAEHELLINQFEEETENLRKQIKQESDARKRFVEEVKNLKQQLADTEAQNKRVLEKLALIVRSNQELEQKLANKENTITNLVEDNRASQEWYKKQLAEKEKEIEIHKSAIRKMNRNCDTVKCQNKISFCIEKLEHLRKSIDNEIYYCYGDNNINIVINKNKFNEQIDNQIQELKE